MTLKKLWPNMAAFILFAALPGVACAASTPPPPEKLRDPVDQIAATLEPVRRVVYKRVGDRQLYLHIFEPAGHTRADRRPGFISIHGGGWSTYTPRRNYPFAAHAASLGMVGISVEYRLLKSAPGVTVFDCVKDGRSAVRYVRAHAADFGIDPGKIVVHGGSAGGHIAAGTAMFDGIDEAGEDTAISCAPNALVLHFPVVDLSGSRSTKLGGTGRWQDISPLHRVRSGLPPTIIFQGAADTVTPLTAAQAFHDAMRQAGNRCELIVDQAGVHGYLMRDRTILENTLRRTETFLGSLGLVKNPKASPVNSSR